MLVPRMPRRSPVRRAFPRDPLVVGAGWWFAGHLDALRRDLRWIELALAVVVAVAGIGCVAASARAAGGGAKKGCVYGATDDFGYHATENRVTMADFHATVLHLLWPQVCAHCRADLPKDALSALCAACASGLVPAEPPYCAATSYVCSRRDISISANGDGSR